MVIGPASYVLSRDEQGAGRSGKFHLWANKSSASYKISSLPWLEEVDIFSFLKPYLSSFLCLFLCCQRGLDTCLAWSLAKTKDLYPWFGKGTEKMYCLSREQLRNSFGFQARTGRWERVWGWSKGSRSSQGADIACCSLGHVCFTGRAAIQLLPCGRRGDGNKFFLRLGKCLAAAKAPHLLILF